MGQIKYYSFKYDASAYNFEGMDDIREAEELLNFFSKTIVDVLFAEYRVSNLERYKMPPEKWGEDRCTGCITRSDGAIYLWVGLSQNNEFVLNGIDNVVFYVKKNVKKSITETEILESIRLKLVESFLMPADSVVGQKHEKDGGCYVATAVYGSYDCSEVWVLRRFRDYFLAKSIYGRLFIKTYYTVSPTLVKWFGDTRWFHLFFKRHLDKLVNHLKMEGYEDTPYKD